MRVTLLSYDFGEYNIRLASALATHAEVQLILPVSEASPHVDKLSANVETMFFSKPRLREPARQLQTLATIIAAVRKFRPDVLHIQQGHMWFNLGLPFLRQTRIVVTIHDVEPHLGDSGALKTPRQVMNVGFRRADRLILHSSRLIDAAVTRCRVDRNKISVVPHIKIGQDYDNSQARDELPLKVLFFGRIWPYKGLEYLIAAEPYISSAIPNSKIVIAGRGEDFRRYERLMTNRSRFDIHNEYIPENAAHGFFSRSAVVVLPYVEASQTGVISFAYAARRPVVATTVGGLPDLIDHGTTGFLIPPRDDRALAEAIVTLLRDEQLRRTFGENGRNKIEAECGAQVVAEKTYDVYHLALRSQ